VLNSVTLIGRLTRNPEMRLTQGGIAVANFSLAVDRGFTNQQGEKETDFIDIVAWRKLAEVVTNNLGKGRLVAVSGRLEIQRYQDKEGNNRRAAKVVADQVVFLDYKDKGQKQGEQGKQDPATGGYEVAYNPDDIPW
jgi:single-strand DNA-binding protein